MLHCSWDMVCDRCNCYFSFWAVFCPFAPLTAPKTQNFNKMKICFIVTEIWHVMDVIVIFHLGYFCPFTPLTVQKMKVSQKWKKYLDISSFYTSVPKIMIIYATLFLRMVREECNSYFSFWAIFLLFYLSFKKVSPLVAYY